MPPFSRPDISEIILQAGQLILQGQRQGQQIQMEREQLDFQRKQADANMKLREENLELQRQKLEAETLTAQTKAKSEAEAAPFEQIKTQAQAQSAVLGLEKLQQEINFDKAANPFKLHLAQANATLKGLEAQSAASLGNTPEALKEALDISSKKFSLMSNILSTAQESGKLHVRNPTTRDKIMGPLGPDITQKYGSREYGWFYNMRAGITKALAAANPGERRAQLRGLGVPDGQEAKTLNDVNSVISAFEVEFSNHVKENIGNIPANFKAMSEEAARTIGTGSQSATTFTPSDTQSAQTAQITRINGLSGEALAREISNLAGDLSVKNGVSFGTATNEVLKLLPPEKFAEAVQSLNLTSK